MEVLFESANVRARRVPHASAVLVVTFANYEEAPGKDAPGFGEGFFGGLGIDAIHVTAARNDWFQYPEMPALCRAVAAAAAGKRVIAYGSSMGGYAALRFAGALGAVNVVAISPQHAIARTLVPWERRWRAEARRICFLPWRDAGAPPPAILLFDPHNPDARHAAAWARERPVTAIALPHAGHPATTFLAQVGLLGETLRAIVEDRFDPEVLRIEARLRRRGSAEYLARLANAQPAHRRRLALALAARAATLGDGGPYLALHAMLLYRAGDDAGAEAAYRAALVAAPEYALARFRLSRFLQRTGRYAEALDLAEAALALDPGSRALRRHRRALLNATAGRFNPRRSCARIVNLVLHRMNRVGWRRGWRAWDRLARP